MWDRFYWIVGLVILLILALFSLIHNNWFGASEALFWIFSAAIIAMLMGSVAVLKERTDLLKLEPSFSLVTNVMQLIAFLAAAYLFVQSDYWDTYFNKSQIMVEGGARMNNNGHFIPFQNAEVVEFKGLVFNADDNEPIDSFNIIARGGVIKQKVTIHREAARFKYKTNTASYFSEKFEFVPAELKRTKGIDNNFYLSPRFQPVLDQKTSNNVVNN